MNKAELIERLIDSLTGMGSEDPEDTACCRELSITEAGMYLSELRANEKEFLEPDEQLPAEITPEIYMEAFNCYVRKCKYEVTRDRLADYIKTHENIDVSDLCRDTYYYMNEDDTLVYPTDWLTENMEFPFTCEDLSMLELIVLGQNSPDFKANMDYCWYDAENKQLHSTDTPFADGLVHATPLAEFIISDPVILKEVIITYMTKEEAEYIFEHWDAVNISEYWRY